VNEQPKEFEDGFIKFIIEISKESAPSTVAFWRDSLKKFLEVNRVKGVDWEYVSQFIPRIRKSGLDRAPTVQEIRSVLSVGDLRAKCAVLFLCSSGARIGSVEYLHWRDFREVDSVAGKMARVTIYSGEPEQYDSFVTPECWATLLAYRQMREEGGEQVTDWSPVFVWNPKERGSDPSVVRPLGVRPLKNQLGRLMNQLNLRKVVQQKKRYRCYEVKQVHGYRKHFKTRMELSGVRPIITEMLMGHALGVAGSYMKPTQAEMLEEYSKAIANLSILDSGPLNRSRG
jgi:integrase